MKPPVGFCVAMPAFPPERLPDLDGTKGRARFPDRSPGDTVSPFRSTQGAERQLTKKGAKAKLVPCEDGHGRYGDLRDRRNRISAERRGTARNGDRGCRNGPRPARRRPGTRPAAGRHAAGDPVRLAPRPGRWENRAQEGRVQLRIVPLTPSLRADFGKLLREGSAESARCLCTAYHGGGEEGAGCRARLFASGVSDGYLLYRDGAPAGWCQCAAWESLPLLAKRPPPADGAFAIPCMVILPKERGKGLAHALLREVLADLRRRGVAYAVAFGHRLGPTYGSPLPELPESVCVKAGMALLRDDPECPLYGVALGTGAGGRPAPPERTAPRDHASEEQPS